MLSHMLTVTNFVLFPSLILPPIASLFNMASTVTPSVESSSVAFDTSPNSSSATMGSPHAEEHHVVLLAIYTVVLLSGGVSLSLMMYMMKSSVTSSTSIAVLNLIFTHFVFLLTVPFRIYYYAAGSWKLGLGWCKVTSGMIHIHMYMSFIFYVIILASRLVTFYRRPMREISFLRAHALLVSLVVWAVVLVVFPCVMFFFYGKDPTCGQDPTHCFGFGKCIKNAAFKAFNYIVSTVIIAVSLALTALQANATLVLYRKHQTSSSSLQLDFGAHLKSLCFALIVTVCFVPYHIFRLTYLEKLELQNVNEVFLSLTTFNCLDMLTFLGNRQCYMCLLGKKT